MLRRIAQRAGIDTRHLIGAKYSTEDLQADAMYRPAAVQARGPGMAARTRVFDLEAPPLVLRALAALPQAGLRSVETLITASCTHASSPGIERPIFEHTPVPLTASRWNLGFMGCSAGLAAVRLALETSAQKRVALIVACELSSLHFQYSDEIDQLTANVLFADGAASMLLSDRPSPLRVVACRCAAVPECAGQMVWFAGDHGLQLRLSPDLPQTLALRVPAILDDFLRDQGLQRSDVAHWLIHPGGPQILDAMAECLGLPCDALACSRAVFREFGNMSSPTIFFILQRHLASRAGGYALALAFGPGLTVEMLLLNAARE